MLSSSNFILPIHQEERDWGLRDLASAVLHQTAKDWDKGKECREIQSFLQSKQFFLFARFCGLDPESYREKLISGKYDQEKLRKPKPYRKKEVRNHE